MIHPSTESYDDFPQAIEFYDYIPPYRTRHDVSFFIDCAKRFGDPVLELGCGSGRILLAIARAGYRVTGIDLSEGMLNLCRQKLRQEKEEMKQRVTLHRVSMTEFSFNATFSLAITPFRSFQHLYTVDEQLECLHRVYKHLRNDGILVLDVFNPYLPSLYEDRYLCEISDEPEFIMPDGRRVHRSNRIVARDLDNQILTIEFIYYVVHKDGYEERIVQRARMRYFFRFEVEHLLERSGFTITERYSDYDRSPAGKVCPGEIIVLARKN